MFRIQKIFPTVIKIKVLQLKLKQKEKKIEKAA